MQRKYSIEFEVEAVTVTFPNDVVDLEIPFAEAKKQGYLVEDINPPQVIILIIITLSKYKCVYGIYTHV